MLATTVQLSVCHYSLNGLHKLLQAKKKTKTFDFKMLLKRRFSSIMVLARYLVRLVIIFFT